jgi:hypothetical protein
MRPAQRYHRDGQKTSVPEAVPGLHRSVFSATLHANPL